MEPQTFDFKPETPKLSKEMQATLAKTEAALKQMWEREKREAQTVYEITIPTQNANHLRQGARRAHLADVEGLEAHWHLPHHEEMRCDENH